MKDELSGPGWYANEGWWTYASAHIPWLGSRSLYVVEKHAEREVLSGLRAGGYECVVIEGESITDQRSLVDATKAALRLWEYCGYTWDSWADCLSDLNVIWPETDRLALLWRDSDALLKTCLPVWLDAVGILKRTSEFLEAPSQLKEGQWLSPDHVPFRRMVFETFCFVEGFGGQAPSATGSAPR